MRTNVSLLAVAAVLLVPAGASAEAGALRGCGEVNTRNGGKARTIQATGGTKCRTARRVARRATGRRFSALGFTCYKPTRVPGEFNKLYGCAKPGTSRGIGFFYRGPRR
jgi:hypothetical protein